MKRFTPILLALLLLVLPCSHADATWHGHYSRPGVSYGGYSYGGYSAPIIYSYPTAPVYYTPPVTYSAPIYYVAPQPVYYQPAPVTYAPPAAYTAPPAAAYTAPAVQAPLPVLAPATVQYLQTLTPADATGYLTGTYGVTVGTRLYSHHFGPAGVS